MNIEKMSAILQKIKEYDKIFLFRHIRNDGDAVGSTKGLKEILKLTYPEKQIYLIDDDNSDYLAFLGPEDEQVSDDVYAEALGIVLDTATPERISNKKYVLCKELVKIDHHIETTPYGSCSWVEEEKSSTCEMVAEFYHTFKDELKINEKAATYIFTGMVTDSGRFRFRSVSGDTMRYAGMLLDLGVNTDILYANLYLHSFDDLKFKSYVYKNMKITDNGVAYIYVSRAARKKYGISFESACTAISLLDSIKGSLIWIAFIEEDRKNTIRVRLRSRFVTVNDIGEHFRGGGHDCASGATVYNKKEVKALIAEADKKLGEFKATEEGWL